MCARLSNNGMIRKDVYKRQEFTFDGAVYTATAYVEGEEGHTPASPVRLEIAGGDSTIQVPEAGGDANLSLIHI